MPVITTTTVDYVRNALKNGKRLDARKLEEFRNISIDHEVSVNAEGCARAKIGNTEVIAGIKFGLGTPYPDSPDKGSMSVAAEFPPLGDPEFEAGMPGAEEVEVSRVVDRAIRESHCIDFTKLCIEAGKKVYMVFIDILVINNDGNLLDAAGLAAIAALKHTKIPAVIKEGEEYKIDPDNHAGNLELESTPISITVRKSDNGMMVIDCTQAEERALPARLTIGSKDDGNIASLQMGGSASFTPEEIIKAAKLAAECSQMIRTKHLK